MGVLDDSICWIIFIFAYPVKVMLKSYCSRISGKPLQEVQFY